MAEKVLGVFTIHNPPVGSVYSADDAIYVYWDDVLEQILVKKNNVAYTGGGDIGNRGENYNFNYGISSYENDRFAIAVYSFCDGADLNWFRMDMIAPVFPYFARVVTVDSPVCIPGGPVCDIIFSGPAQITHATNLTGNNGEITVSAISSNGTVKYGLTDFDYATEGQLSGTLDGLAPATYTVYAKDANGCTAINTITILYRPAYGEHYQVPWDDVHENRDARVRIYEREYLGDVVELPKSGGEVFKRRKPKQEAAFNDKFFPVHPTTAQLNLLSRVDLQFLPLFTQDPKRYLCVLEYNDGAGWVADGSWFIAPSLFNEKYAAPPYYSSFELTDNVKFLQETPFTDINGNLLNGVLKLIEVISFVLKRTGLDLNIRSGLNIFEENHNTGASDDPLDQTYIDIACYREDIEPFSCWDVLSEILKPFGARVFQDENMWIIEEVDRAQDGYAYRIFDPSGNYVSNGTVDPVKDIVPSGQVGPSFAGGGHNLEIIPAYGKITITSKLNYTGAMVAGGFEKSDLINPDSETFLDSSGVFTSEEGFKDWSLRMIDIDGVSFGRIQDDNRSVGAFFYNHSLNSYGGNLRDAYIESAEKPFQYGSDDLLRIAFEHSSPAPAEFEFMVIRAAIKLGTQYLQEDLSWHTDEHILRIYAKPGTSGVQAPVRRQSRSGENAPLDELRSSPSKNTTALQKFEVTAPLPSTSVDVDTTIQMRIYFYAPLFYDYGSPATSEVPSTGTDGKTDLKALDTVGIDFNYSVDVRRHRGFGLFVGYERHFLILRVDDSSEDDPRIIRPDDFHATDNPKIWYLVKSIIENATTASNGRGKTVKFLIDNVSVDSLPNGQEPPEEKVIEYQISKYINEDLAIELYNGDLPEISNGKNIYNNYFRLSDGTPTAVWARSGVTEQNTIQGILLNVLASNHSAPTIRLYGGFVHKFGRIKIGDYLRLTRDGSNLVLLNTGFETNLNSWTQAGAGEAFVWSADNSGSAQVSLSGAEDSQKISQAVSHLGGFIEIVTNIQAVPASGNTREDNLYVIFYSGGAIIHQERLKTFAVGETTGDHVITHKAFIPSSWDRIGFLFKNITGDGDCVYNVGDFSADGVDILDVFQIADYESMDKSNLYQLELIQISKPYLSLAGIDTGGTGQTDNTGVGLLLEDGSGFILNETGDNILLE
jgi:hypothetical protein